MEKEILIVQSLAVFEVVHAVIKFTRSSPISVLAQVLSRIGVVYLVMKPVPEVHENFAFTTCLIR